MSDVDIDQLRRWIGGTEVQTDTITETLNARFCAVVGRPPPDDGSGVAGLGLHWCLAAPAVDNDRLGPDGHPAPSSLLPPVPLAQRMWVGGELTIHQPLRIHDVVSRRSTIDDVRLTQGRSGALCFITVRHDYETGRGLSIRERQDIVYRSASAANVVRAGDTVDMDRPGDLIEVVEPTTILLFRYSALTFNAHRIHYDRNYARDIEGYPGLVVQGPLQATLLMRLAQGQAREPLTSFAYRSVSPLIDGAPFTIRARRVDAGAYDLRTMSADGRITMTAEARW